MPLPKPQEGSLPDHIQEEYTRTSKLSSMSKIQDIREDYRRYLRLCITTAWQKLNKYYTKLGDSPLFATAIILHPGLGIRYLEAS
jgi:hypothetical protein